MLVSDLKTYAVTYGYVPDILERRQPYREEHLARIREGIDSGSVLVVGVLADPVDSALLILRAANPGEIYAWVGDDPYATAGLIQSVTVREWNIVLGEVAGKR